MVKIGDLNVSNVTYTFSEDGKIGYGKLKDGTVFIFDADMISKIKDINFYRSLKNQEDRKTYIIDRYGKTLHNHLFAHRKGYEIDHINLNTFDNRRCNIRYCTHQQNQCNQPLQRNNLSGVSGVSYYPPKHKFRARIKICQHDIHLGYYETFGDAVIARNIGMACMFGEYGRYNEIKGEIPWWILGKVIKICKRFADLSICKAFFYYVNHERQKN